MAFSLRRRGGRGRKDAGVEWERAREKVLLLFVVVIAVDGIGVFWWVERFFLSIFWFALRKNYWLGE